MTGPVAVPFQTGQIVVVGAGPAQSRRWYRTTVQRTDSRIVWVDGAPEDGPTVQVQPGETVTCHTWRHMDVLYRAEARVAFTRLAPDLALPPTALHVSQNHHRQAGRNVVAPIRLRGRVVALPDRPEPLNLRARVVRPIETGRPLDLTREIGVVFVDLTRATQERIIRVALDVQRDRRRRGLM